MELLCIVTNQSIKLVSFDTNWIISNDSSGTESLLKIITSFGTTAISNATTSMDSVIDTDDFDDGTYTIRIEHGQYYGEKSVLFSSIDIEDDTVITSEQVTSNSIVDTQTSTLCDLIL